MCDHLDFFSAVILNAEQPVYDGSAHMNRHLSNQRRKTMDEYEIRKIGEYKSYNPENAVADAERDIKAGTIKLFYLDVEEFPKVIAIDAPAEKLPEAEQVSIGIGCIDPIHADDCATAYRSAMEQALSYGMRYNQVIAKSFNLKQKTEPDFLPSETLDFFGYPNAWTKARLELRDVQPLFGGRDILLTAAGPVFIRTVRYMPAGRDEKIYRLPPDTEVRRRILHACILHDFVGLQLLPQTAPPDHGRPEIILTNATGRQYSLTSWEPPLPGSDPAAVKRFHAVYKEFLRLEAVAQETPSAMYIKNADNTIWEKLRSNNK